LLGRAGRAKNREKPVSYQIAKGVWRERHQVRLRFRRCRFESGNRGELDTLVSSPGGSVLENGRRLSDGVMDTLFNILTNGAISTDNLRDDNGLKITDGSVDPVSGQTRAIAFPYIGIANNPPGEPSP
jgi:hypothetical protein